MNAKDIESLLQIVSKALAKVSIKDNLNKDLKENAQHLLVKAQRHFDDAVSFNEKGRLTEAFASINYVQGVLDAGSCLGFFDNSGAFCS